MITPQEAKERWQGTFAPLVTVFNKDGSLNIQALQRNTQWLMDKGARTGNTVMMAVGSGGDFTSMTVEQRKQAIGAITEVVAGRAPVMAGAQSVNVQDCIEICQFCEDAGVDAVQISGPFYYDGRWGDVVAWMKQIARHTDIGFLIYNNWYTGYNMPIELIEELLDIPNSVGVKWGCPDVYNFMEGLRRFVPRAATFDNNFLPVLSHMYGSRCFISFQPNFCPEHSWLVWDLLQAGKYAEAQKEWDRFTVPFLKLRSAIVSQTGAEGVQLRPFLQLAGLEPGVSPLPSRDEVITPELREEFKRVYEDIQAAVRVGN